MPERPWKHAERELARRLRGQRVKRHGVAAPDIVTPYLVAEVKLRKRLPRWITDALLRLHALCGPRKLRVVILQERDSPYTLVVMELDDFEGWFGPIKANREE